MAVTPLIRYNPVGCRSQVVALGPCAVLCATLTPGFHRTLRADALFLITNSGYAHFLDNHRQLLPPNSAFHLLIYPCERHSKPDDARLTQSGLEALINITAHIPPAVHSHPQPRAQGAAWLRVKPRDGRTVIETLHQQGSLKLLFPRGTAQAMTAVSLNTAGGITGGDQFDLAADVAAGCHLTLTTQAAERAYRAQPDQVGQVDTRLSVADGGRLDWLPQETLLYDDCAVTRSLRARLVGTARFLMCEPVVFGRAAMGETRINGLFRDRVDLWRDGALIFSDRTELRGAITDHLAGPATGGGAGAMASVLLAAPDADTQLDPARALMPAAGGISLIRPGVLFARILAPDSFALRHSLMPLLRLLASDDLPRTWMI